MNSTNTTPAPRKKRQIRITPIMERILQQLTYGPQSTLQLAADLEVYPYDLWRWLKILQGVGRIEVAGKKMTGFQGRPPHVWKLSPEKP